MSGAALCIDCSSNTSFPATASNGESNALRAIYAQIRKTFLGHTNTFARPRYESEELLLETYIECSELNWDGEGALPVREEALFEALRFIENLPTTISMPTDIAAEANGFITMEWRKRPSLIFNISFTGKNEIYYAGILGTSEPRGKMYFGVSIPKDIIEKIQDTGI